MQLHKTLTATILVVAKNNERHITYLLRSIIKQNVHDYRLDKIIVICDGSSDHTVSKVAKYTHKYPQITMVYYSDSIGNNARIEAVAPTISSDITVVLSADIVLGGTNFFRDLLTRFYAEKIMMVSAISKPIKGQGLSSKILFYQNTLLSEFASYCRDTNLIYSIDHEAYAVKTSFLSGVNIPKKLPSAIYLYLLAIYSGYSVLRCDSAKAILVSDNVSSKRQSIIELLRDGVLNDKFGDLINREIHIAPLLKITIYLKTILNNPINITKYIILTITMIIMKMKTEPKHIIMGHRSYRLRHKLPSY